MKAPDLTLPFYIRLQRLFYIIPPNESSFKTLDEVPNYVVEVGATTISKILLSCAIFVFGSVQRCILASEP